MGGRQAQGARAEQAGAGSASRRTIARSTAGLPGSRALVGGLLVAVAGVGMFAATTSAADRADAQLVVADRALRAGEVIEADDLRLTEGALPAGIGFGSIEDVVGRAALGPVEAGEVVQAGAVTADRAATSRRREVALSLPRSQVAVGRLRAGDRVDVFVTVEDGTWSIVQGVEVVELSAEGDGGLTSEREVALVLAVESGDLVAALVHAMRTGEVTVVRSTFADETGEVMAFEPAGATPEGG